MMAEVHKLDGSVVDATKPIRDEEVANLLADVVRLNNEGKIAAIAVVMVQHDFHCMNCSASEIGVPGSVMLGAMDIMKDGFLRKVVVPSSSFEPWRPEKADD